MATDAGRLTVSTGPAVHIERLTRRFGDRIVLDSLDLDVAPGEFVALLGRSGSGKSTLLRALAQLDHDGTGEGTLRVPANRAVVFQDSRLLPWARVLDNVVLGLREPDARARGLAALDEVGLGGRERAWPNELSGGEQQRVAIARAFVNRPMLLIADEPTGNLDPQTSVGIMKLLDRINRTGTTVVMATHDQQIVDQMRKRVIELEKGRLVRDQSRGVYGYQH
jgi:sulfonate transport system ATP-binding protein